MGKKRGNPNNKENIMQYFSPKRTTVDPEKGSAQAQREGLHNPERNVTTRGSTLKDFNHKPKMKSEEATVLEEAHSHEFLFKFDNSDTKYTIQCDHPQTVLQAITSKLEIKDKIKCAEDKIILQKGKAEMVTAIATHFPCKLLKVRELVTLKEKTEVVEVRDTKRDFRVYQDEHYYVVYIDKEGGTNTKTKKLFRSSAIKSFSLLCVYGTENMTLRDAIEWDGRFMELGDFKLEDFEKGKVHVFSDDKIQSHEGKTFRISLEKNILKKADKSSKDTDEAVPQQTCEAASGKADESVDTEEAGPSRAEPGPSSARAKLNTVTITRWVPVSDLLKTKQTAGDSKEVEKIYKLLRAQFPKLKEQLLRRYSDSDTESLKMLKETLKKVDFGKALQVFKEVDRIKDLFEKGNSVCKITVSNICCGTGFVLFRHYILTNAHLFFKVMYNNNVRPDIDIIAMFNYEKPHQQNTLDFKVRNTFTDYNREMDYAILELVVNEGDESKVPPGLMKHCCPMPESGEACLIGHPNGEVKQFDPTCIIEKENRINEVHRHLKQYEGSVFTLMAVEQMIQNQGIKRILTSPDPTLQSRSDPLCNKVVSYNTFMFNGSSGSPVFDANGKVFGLHSAGFTYVFGPSKGSVLEYAHPVLLILQKFVTNLRTRNNTGLLRAVEEELQDCPYRMEIMTGEERMDES